MQAKNPIEEMHTEEKAGASGGTHPGDGQGMDLRHVTSP